MTDAMRGYSLQAIEALEKIAAPCYAFVGPMEGALNSGVSVAKRLAQRDGVVK